MEAKGGSSLRFLAPCTRDRLFYKRSLMRLNGVMTFSVPEVADLRARVKSVGAFGEFSTVDFTLVGLGLNLVFGVMRIVNLAHGDFLMLGGIAAWALFSGLGLHPLVSAILVVVVFLIVGLPIYYAVVPRLLRSRDAEMLSLILFFGVSQMIRKALPYTLAKAFCLLSGTSFYAVSLPISHTREKLTLTHVVLRPGFPKVDILASSAYGAPIRSFTFWWYAPLWSS